MRWSEAFLQLGLLVLLTGAVGCSPDIGDPCRVPVDCGFTGGVICDTTLPGGYCTQFNCEPGSCPDEAVCVAYRQGSSTAPGCEDPQVTRFERMFCMRSCTRDSDCRQDEGYACVDLSGRNPWGATVVERRSVDSRVCALPFDGQEIGEDRRTEVCFGASEFSPQEAPDGAAQMDAAPDGTAPDDAASMDAAPLDAAMDASLDLGDAAGGNGDDDASVSTDAPADAGTFPDAG